MTTAAPYLQLEGVSKHFGGVQALDRATLIVREGEVHGLLGENGSGKSTLIKILAGFHAPDSGTLEIEGREIPLPLHPGQFRELGLSFVHQDLGLIPTISVAENLQIGHLATVRGRPWRSPRKAAAFTRETLGRYGIALDPGAPVSSLRPVERALLAIVRAVEARRGTGGMLVLDEPTVFLPRADVERLFALVREIAAGGASVLFVSHDLDEVAEITDRVTVLRDGRNVGTVVTSETPKARLVELIIGRQLAELHLEHHDRRAEAAPVRVVGLRGGTVVDISFEVHEGELLGVTGLVGSGFEDVPYLLIGARRARNGTMTIEGRELHLPAIHPRQALDAGVALIPADRPNDGALMSLSVADNTTMQVVDGFTRVGTLRRRALAEHARKQAETFDVRPADPTLRYSALSGGNQQKALLAKWLETRPRLLVLHEPTQGVDVGARQQIFELVRSVADKGTAVVCASSDYEQLGTICDRVLVLGRGRISAELVGGQVTKERITEQAYSSVPPAVAAGGAG